MVMEVGCVGHMEEFVVESMFWVRDGTCWGCLEGKDDVDWFQ